MSTKKDASSANKALTQETQAIWNRNALFWDEKMGEGDSFQQILVGPATERLLDLHAGELVLDIACGNGVFSRRLAQLGMNVVATDFSDIFLEQAKKRTIEHANRIEYLLVDATDEHQLLALGQRKFDAAVCTMALMDMSTISPLVSALSQLLKISGRFVFSVSHPCFYSGGTKMMEEEDREGKINTTYSLKISKYAGLSPKRGLGIIGQPVPHYYFHKPISVLFKTCFLAGFVLDDIEEPIFNPSTDSSREKGRPLDWELYQELPPVLIARMRLLQTNRGK
jgi:SAM-dependent methyltransferase